MPVKFEVIVDLLIAGSHLTAGSHYEYEDFALKWTESVDLVNYSTSHLHHWNQNF